MTTVNYLGTHETSWLRSAGVPLFISHRRLARLKRTLPVAIAPWALDSGGFSELSLYGGWKTTPSEYYCRFSLPVSISQTQCPGNVQLDICVRRSKPARVFAGTRR